MTTQTKKAIANAKSNYPEFTKIINAVISQVSEVEILQDVMNHGANCGYGGITYYSDTVKFAENKANRKQIISMLEMQANYLGVEVVEMFSGFGTFRNNPMDNEDKRDLYRYLSETKCQSYTIPNLMCWYACEEVARWIFDN
jgi:hypothetical protein